ncbi:hypothetical protein AMAG_18864 [Allomyces macrogynus ATCC 38327]|uniref:DUF4246 domain-containing protein n=1 Tax=Allomyces macrogynus (strain ATCC 38327) TaxID=578462 RepID=A0A0L0SJ07_ALLM3|nr:hypothetical protein AMAG_18864 [Allomyces macrogynus ATCC 38327]|eukprot:KNE62439.1 hypothetical protein AMAG_18864 [Allomyces macrogynus ATCC 38327]
MTDQNDASRRIAGMANEANVATALYFFDLDNIFDAKIQFRSTIQWPECEDYDYRGIEFVLWP